MRWIGLLLACALVVVLENALGEDWPQWRGPQRDGVWRETGILEVPPAEGLKTLWSTPILPGYSGPAVAGNKVFITDRQLAPDARNPANPFAKGDIPGSERVVCLDAKTGRILWVHAYDCTYRISYPSGPRTTPCVDGPRVFTLGAEGHLVALSAEKGEVLWARHFPTDFGAKSPTWGFAAHPFVDGDHLICTVGGPGAGVVALDKRTGRVVWKQLDVQDIGYSPPVIHEAGGVRQLIFWHPKGVAALDPKDGTVLWELPDQPVRYSSSVATPVLHEGMVFVSAFYNGSKLLRVGSNPPTGDLLWKSPKITEKDTVNLHCLSSTPYLEDGHIYGVCNYGQLRCLRLEDGQRVWEDLNTTTGGEPIRSANAFLVRHEDRCLILNDRGELVVTRLSPQGVQVLGRAPLIPATSRVGARELVWSHPAFAHRSIFARNDDVLIRVDMEAPAP